MKTNISVITTFSLTGLNESMNLRLSLFVVTLLFYCFILLVNITVIITIVLDTALHEPMYLLLCVFCFNALFGTLGFYPKFLSDLLSPVQVISYGGCLLQAWVLYSFVGGDITILTVMAYDRYLAICRPLQYHKILSKRRLCGLMLYSSGVPLGIIGVIIFLTSRLQLCSTVINKFFCVNWVIVQLACSPSDKMIIDIVTNIVIMWYFCHCSFILWSYVYLAKNCLASSENKAKFLQTCVPHLVSLFVFLFSILFDISRMKSGALLPQSLQNFFAIETFIFPPLINPLIYGFKLTKIRRRIIGCVTFKGKSSF